MALADPREALEANADLTYVGRRGARAPNSDFLQSLNDSPFLSDPVLGTPTTSTTLLPAPLPYTSAPAQSTSQPLPPTALDSTRDDAGGAPLSRRETLTNNLSVPGSPINKTEKFLLTAADQKDGSRSDRLARVIHAKFEAGLLRPYNHVAGYTRLMRWMADK